MSRIERNCHAFERRLAESIYEKLEQREEEKSGFVKDLMEWSEFTDFRVVKEVKEKTDVYRYTYAWNVHTQKTVI